MQRWYLVRFMQCTVTRLQLFYCLEVSLTWLDPMCYPELALPLLARFLVCRPCFFPSSCFMCKRMQRTWFFPMGHLCPSMALLQGSLCSLQPLAWFVSTASQTTTVLDMLLSCQKPSLRIIVNTLGYPGLHVHNDIWCYIMKEMFAYSVLMYLECLWPNNIFKYVKFILTFSTSLTIYVLTMELLW